MAVLIRISPYRQLSQALEQPWEVESLAISLLQLQVLSTSLPIQIQEDFLVQAILDFSNKIKLRFLAVPQLPLVDLEHNHNNRICQVDHLCLVRLKTTLA